MSELETSLKYKRVILKVSGEALAGKQGFGIDPATIHDIAQQIKAVCELGVETALVVGGGNIWRGATGSAKGMDRVTADYMGMLATVMNGLALQDALESIGVVTRVQTAVEMRQIAEPYIRRRALRHLGLGRVVIFAAGTGNPYFSTDTAATLRGAELGADVVMMAKNIDGVYSADPKTDPDAVKYDEITYDDILSKHLKVIDSTAASMALDNRLTLLMFALKDPENILRAVHGEKIGTLVKA